MQRSHLLGPVVLSLLILTAGCSQLPGVSGGPDQRTGSQAIQASGAGSIERAPDQAIVRLGVVSRGDDIAAVQSELAENVQTMREALREEGIDDDQIRTRRYNLGQNRRFDPDRRPSEPRYEGRHSFVVTLDEPDRAGDIVVTAVQNGASRVRGVSFTLSDERRRELRADAIHEAVENARAEATAAAEGAGLRITSVHTVRTTELRAEPYRVRSTSLLSAQASGGGVTPEIARGPVTVTARVLVTYNATEA